LIALACPQGATVVTLLVVLSLAIAACSGGADQRVNDLEATIAVLQDDATPRDVAREPTPEPPTTSTPTQGLGAQPRVPIPPEDEDPIYWDFLEISLGPGENRFVDFRLDALPTNVMCSNVTCSKRFTWSVRQPANAVDPSVEFFIERQGAHGSLGASNVGESAVGFTSPVSVYNRSQDRILVEVRYIVTHFEAKTLEDLSEEEIQDLYDGLFSSCVAGTGDREECADTAKLGSLDYWCPTHPDAEICE